MKQKKGLIIKEQNIEDLSAEKLLQLAEEKNQQMDYEQARFFYDKAYSKDPHNDVIVLCYADSLKQNGDEEQSKQVLESSLAANVDGNYKRYFQLAELYEGVKSIETFERGIQAAKAINLKQYNMFRNIKLNQKELRRDIANAYAAIAQVCLTDLLDVKQAEPKCLEALKLGAEIDSSCLDIQLQCANYMLYRDDTDGARNKLLKIYNHVKSSKQKVQQKQEDQGDNISDEAKTQAAKYLIEVECFNEAIEILNDVNETGKDQQIVYLLAYCNFKAKNFPECLSWLQEYDGLIKEGDEVDPEIAEAVYELKQQIDKLDPKLLEQPNDTGLDVENDDDWMDVE